MNRINPRNAFFAAAALAALVAASSLAAQEPGNVPETKAPPAAQAAPATPPAPTAEQVAPAPKANDEQNKAAWARPDKYKEADLALGPPAADEDRVVFMGDSITEAWHFTGPQGSFNGKPYVNRGVSGQATPHMLIRFQQDVIALQPKVVVILAGTNDIGGNAGPMTLEQTEANLATMAELATANHIRVVLCSVLPALDFPWHHGQVPAPKIVALNDWIKAYAAEKGYVYVDFHSAMKDEHDGLPPMLSRDGVHPLPAGYAVMTPLVEEGIKKALGL